MTRATSRHFGSCSGLAAGLLLSVLAQAWAGADHWAVEGTTLRIDVEVTQAPSDPAAGVLAILPDGGLLPRPFPEATVVAPNGQSIPSQVVWHHPLRGLAVAFAATNDLSHAWIYLRGLPTPLPPINRGLAPSLLLFTRPGPAELDKAARIPSQLPDRSETLMGMIPNISLSDNPLGPHAFFQTYVSGWIRRAKTTRIYFCTISQEESELRIDGRTVAQWPANRRRADGARGQFGSWLDVAAGLHHVEYVHYAKDGAKELQAAWRIPGETPGELPVPIPESAFLHSGRCRPVRADFRDGRPAALVTGNLTPSRYYWFGERPTNLYELRADLLGGTTNDTTCTWTFNPDQRMVWPHATWVFEGGATNSVTLTVSNRRGQTKITAPIDLQGEAPRGHVLNDTDRAWFRAVLLDMCQSTAPGKSPCARWSPDLWETLVNIVPPFEGTDLLKAVFSGSRRETLALERTRRWMLEDVFLGGLRAVKPEEAAGWLERFEKEEPDSARRLDLKQERLDLTLYDLGDTVAARALATEIQSSAQKPEQKLRAMIRLGDVERAVSNLEAAVTLYGDAQDRYHEQLRRDPAPPKPAPSVVAQGPRRKLRLLSTRAYGRAPDRDWKTLAVREAAFYSTVSSLVEGRYFFEARETLRQWELEVPLSKLSGDYPLAEAEYYLAAGNVRRALAGLRLYRQSMDISSSLPDVMDLELRCLVQLKRQQEAEALAAEILKQFPNHTAAERARKVLGKG